MISSRLFPVCETIGAVRSEGWTRSRDRCHLRTPYLEICFEDPDNLSAGWPEDSDRFDWQIVSLEVQLGSGERGDHSSGSKLKVLVGKGVIGLCLCSRARLCCHRL